MSHYDSPDIDRLLAAFARRKHDRVPNLEISIDPGALAAIMGWDHPAAARSDMLEPEVQIEVARKTSQDAVICNLQSWLGQGGAIRTREDLERLPPPDLAHARHKAESFFRIVPDRMGVGLMTAGPFFTTLYSTGPIPIESCMLNLYDDPALVETMMDLQLDRQIAILETLSGLPFAFVEIADDLADNRGLLVMRDFYEIAWMPRIRKLVDAIRSLIRTPIQFHCCGRLDPVLPWLAELGVDVLTPIQAGCNDIYAIKRAYGDRFCLSGNMAIDGVLAFGTPEEVAADTRAHIDGLAGDGGYVCASSHSICDAVPAENYYSMIRTAMTHGRYA